MERYPGYDVLAQASTWDDATRAVVEERLAVAGPLRFFTPEEEPALRAFCDAVTAQHEEPLRIPVAEMVDRKLHERRLDGFRFADLPDDCETWRRVLRGLDEAARARGVLEGFSRCATEPRREILDELETGRLAVAALEGINGGRAWSVCMRMVLAAFYAHPWAWNEIGFGGPAYPRGFMRRGPAAVREPFETPPATDADPVDRNGGRRS